jgi:hypothetical protein
VRKLESQGVPTKQAEAITSAITEVLNDSLESTSESFVSKAEMQKVLIIIATARHRRRERPVQCLIPSLLLCLV